MTIFQYTPLLNASYNYGTSNNFAKPKFPEELSALDNLLNHIPTENYNIASVNGMNIKGSTLTNTINNLSITQSILDKGGSIYAVDLETVGGALKDATPLEKEMFAITEMALVRHNVSYMNGQQHIDREVVQNVLLGINERQYDVTRQFLVDSMDRPIESFSSTELSTIERYARLGASEIDYKNGIPQLGKTMNYSQYDIRLALKGALKAKDMGSRGYTLGNTNPDSYGYRELTKLLSNIQQATSGPGKMLVTKNGTKFDLPLLETMANVFGIKTNIGSNSLDIDEVGSTVGFDFTTLYTGDEGVKNGYGKLENIKKAYKIQSVSHEAVDDANVTAEILYKTLNSFGEQKNMIGAFHQHATNVLNNVMYLNEAQNDRVLYVNKALNNINSNNGFALDNIYRIGEDGKRMPVNKSYVLNRNNFYEMKGLKRIAKNQLPLSIAKNIKGNTLFALELSNAAEGSNDHVTIFRESMDEIDDIFANNLKVVKLGKDGVSQGIINSEYQEYIKDLARREYEGFFDLSGKGFNSAERYYSTYTALANRAKQIPGLEGGKFNKQQIAEFIENKKITVNGKEYKAGKLFDRLGYNGVISQEAKRNFVQMADVLEDTHETMSRTISTIKKTIVRANGVSNSVINANRTIALKASRGEIIQELYTLTGAKLLEQIDKPRTYSDLMAFSVNKLVDGSHSKIQLNGRTASSLRGSILGAMRSNAQTALNKNNLDANLAQEYNQILDNFKSFLGKEEYNRLKQVESPWHGADALSKALIKKRTEIFSKYTPDKIINAYSRGIEITKEIEQLKKNGSLTKADAVLEGINSGKTVKGADQILKDGDAVRGKIKALQSELKEIDVIRRIGVLGTNDPVDISNMNGAKFLGKDNSQLTMDQLVKENNLDLKHMATMNSINNINIGSAYKYVNEKDYVLNGKFRNILETELGYGDDEIEIMGRALHNKKYGIANIADENGKKMFGYSFYKKFNPNSETYDYSLIIAKRESLSKVQNSLKKGVIPKDVTVVDLPKMFQENGIDMVSYRGSTRVNTSVFEFYQDNRQVAEEMLGSFSAQNGRVSRQNVSAKALSIIQYHLSNSLPDAFKNGWTGQLGKRTNNSINRALEHSPTPTGYSYVNVDGTIKRILMPTAGLYHKASEFDYGSLVNFIPSLYDSDDNVRNTIDTLLARDGIKNPFDYMEDWKRELGTSNASGYGGTKKLEEVSSSVHAYFIQNFFQGDRLVDKIFNSQTVKDLEEEAPRTYEALSALISGNALLKGEKVIEGRGSFKLITDFTTMGNISNTNRPVAEQDLNYQPIILNKLSKQDLSDLGDARITLGEGLKDIEFVDNVYSNMTNETLNEKNVSAIYKKMNEEEVINALDDILNDKTKYKNVVDRAIEKSGKVMSKEEVKKHIRYMMSVSSTYQQGSIVAPILYKTVFNSDAYSSINISALDEVSKDLAIGQKVTPGQYLGKRDGENIYYEGKREGMIESKQDGHFHVKQFNPAIEEIKVNANGVEKTVSNGYDFTKYDYNLLQGIYESAFGKGVGVVANFETKKHLAGSIVLGNVNYIANQVLASNNSDYINEFLDTFNKNLPVDRLKPKAKTIFQGTDFERQIFQINQHSMTGDLLTGYNNILKAYANKSGDFYDGINNEINRMNANNEYYVSLAQSQLNTEYKSLTDSFATDEERALSKGGGENVRSVITFGSTVGETDEATNLFWTRTENGYVKTGKVIKDRNMDLLLKSAEAKRVQNNLQRIQGAIKAAAGDEEFIESLRKSGQLETVKLNDLLLPAGGISKAKDLESTIFGDRKASILEVELPIEFDNYLSAVKNSKGQTTFTKTNKLYVPLQENTIIKGKLYPSEIQKGYTDILNAMQLLEQGKTNKSPDEVRIELQNKIYELFNNTIGEFTEKDGLLIGGALSGRLEYSGYELIGKILSPIYDENRTGSTDSSVVGKHINPVYNGNMFRKINGKNARMDIVYMGETAFTEKGGENFFKDLGYQLAFKNNFDKDKSFIKHLQENQLLDASGKLINNSDKTLDAIGKEYAKSVGVQGLIKRDPTFMDTSEVVASIRLKEVDDSTNSIITHAYTALKMNADVDADIAQISLLLKQNPNGRREIYNKGSKIRKAYEKLMNAGALENESKWIPKAKQDFIDLEKLRDFDKNIDNYIEYAKNNGMPNGEAFTKNKDTMYLAVKSRFDKTATGQVSNPNYHIKTVGAAFLNQNLDDLNLYKDITNFTNYTEQKPISAKFTKLTTTTDAAEKIANAQDYRKAMELLVKGKTEEGLSKLTSSLSSLGAFDSAFVEKQLAEGSFNHNKIRFGDFSDLLNEIERVKQTADNSKLTKQLEHDLMIQKGMYAITNLFSRDDVREVWDNVYSKRKTYGEDAIGAKLLDIANNNFGSTKTELTNLVEKVLTSDISSTKVKNLSVQVNKYNDTAFIANDGRGVFKVNSGMISPEDRLSTDLTMVGINGNVTTEQIHTPTKRGWDIKDQLSKKDYIPFSVKDLSTEQMQDVSEYSGYINANKELTNDLRSSGIINRTQQSEMLEAFNNEIISKGKIAETINKEQARQMQLNIIHKAYGDMNTRGREARGANYVESTYNAESMLDSVYRRIASGANTSSSGASVDISGYSKYDNLRTYDTNGYLKKLKKEFEDKTSGIENSQGKDVVYQAYVGKHMENAKAERVSTAENLRKNFVDEFNQDKTAFSEYMGWNQSHNELLRELNLNDSNVHDTIKGHLDALGSQRIGAGSFTGVRLGDLNEDQIAQVTDELHKFANVDNAEYYNKNISAIDEYNSYLNKIAQVNSTLDTPNTNVTSTLADAIVGSNFDNSMSASMKESLDNSKYINDAIDNMNDFIKEQGASAGPKTAKVAETVLEQTANEVLKNKSSNARTLLAVGGVMAAVSGLAYVGAVGQMNVNRKPNGGSPDPNGNYDINIKRNTQVVPPRPNLNRSVIMQGNDGVNYRVSGKANASVNDSEVANAITRVMRNQGAKVHFKSSHGYNNNDNWFDEEMSNYLQ